MKPFSLTYVRYPEDDPLGLAMALASLAPFCMIWTTVGAFMARRELWDLLTLLGILLNEVLAQLLKRHFKEPRPATCELVDFCDTHGMPSSHAQLAAFVATMMTLQYVRRREEFRVFCKWNKRGTSGRAGHADAMTAALVVAWPLAWTVGISRVYLGVPQRRAGGGGRVRRVRVRRAAYHEVVCLAATKSFARLDVNDGGLGGAVARGDWGEDEIARWCRIRSRSRGWRCRSTCSTSRRRASEKGGGGPPSGTTRARAASAAARRRGGYSLSYRYYTCVLVSALSPQL